MPTKDWATGRESTTPPSRIPVFASIEEGAEFWDTHDSTEFEDEFEDVEGEMRFVLLRPDERWIPLVLNDHAMTALEERAKQEQIAPMALIRLWVLERLNAT
jgi:CopG antitoxin of type II toxin-antitoxin system